MYESWLKCCGMFAVLCFLLTVILLTLKATDFVGFHVAWCFAPLAAAVLGVPLSSLAMDWLFGENSIK
jgi:inner membrane protein involved in colicin E2 resistance